VPAEQKILTLERRNILVLGGASLFCPNVALCSMSKAFVRVPTEWQFSCVQFRRRWQAIIREDSRMQNASFKSCNLKSCVLKSSWHSSNCFANNPTFLCIASSERSLSKLKLVLWYLLASITNNKSGKVVWSSFEYRNGRNRESWHWWNHKRICFDNGTLSFVLISMLCYLKQEKAGYIDVSMELYFSNTSDTW